VWKLQNFVRHISEKKYFSKIPMFCFRRTSNFKGMLPVNLLTRKKKFHITNSLVYNVHDTLYMIQKTVCCYLLWPSSYYADKGGFLKKVLPKKDYINQMRLFNLQKVSTSRKYRLNSFLNL
jgi:hypothetical protein